MAEFTLRHKDITYARSSEYILGILSNTPFYTFWYNPSYKTQKVRNYPLNFYLFYYLRYHIFSSERGL